MTSCQSRKVIKSANPNISFGTYTGAWYPPSYFEVGVNFASRNYDPSADYDWATPAYKNYGYAELLDLFTVGNYYTTITIEDYLKENPEIKTRLICGHNMEHGTAWKDRTST